MNLRSVLFSLGSLSPVRYRTVKCEHGTKRIGSVSAFGQTIVTRMPKNQDGSIDYCLKCISNMAIKCAWCEDPIFIGNPITLYTPQKGFEIPEHAVVYRENPLQLVGCLGWNCAETGGDRAGFWVPGEDGKGRVLRVKTAYEAILGAKEPSSVIVSDLNDTHEAVNPTLIPIGNKKN